MGAKETILTAKGLRKLEDELENLRSVKRQEVAERIKVAISYGDISEKIPNMTMPKMSRPLSKGVLSSWKQMISTATLIDETAKKEKKAQLFSVLPLSLKIWNLETKKPIPLSATYWKPILRRTVSPMNHRSALRFWDRK